MKTRYKLLITSLITLLGFSAIAAEENPYYFEFGFGRSNGYVPYTGELPSGRYSGASVASVALGKQFNERVAFDVELSYRGEYTNNDDDTNTAAGILYGRASITSLSAMLNGYFFYYDKLPDFRPYVTGGAGLAYNKTGSMTLSGISKKTKQPYSYVNEGDTTTSFAWKLGTGAKYKLDNRFEIDLRYQYVDLGSAKLGNLDSSYRNGQYTGSNYAATKSNRLSSHEIIAGIAYKF